MASKFTTEYFIKRASEIHNNEYTYSKTIYKGRKQKLIITCKIHGDFQQFASSHLQGFKCKFCAAQSAVEKRKNKKVGPKPITKEQFINLLPVEHKKNYDYKLIPYTVAKNIKYSIICSLHGEFKQKAGLHIRGQGCPKCRYLKVSQKLSGYNSRSIFKYLNKNNKNETTFYILNFKNDTEEFIKVGLTTQTINSRFSKVKIYKITPVKLSRLPVIDACRLEEQIIKNYNKFTYKPKHKFKGYLECFTTDILKYVI